MRLTISIITVVYNGEKTLAQTIESVLAQDYPGLEYIVVDGNSTDGTLEVIKRYQHRLGHWVSAPDAGIYDAMNKGLRLATGQVVAFLNADDYYQHPCVVSNVATAFVAQNPDAVYGDLLYVNPRDPAQVVRYWRARNYQANDFLRGWMPPHPTFFAKRTLFDAFGDFNTTLHTAADYELMLRFVHRHGIKLAYLPEVLVRMRTGGVSNRSLGHRWRANREDVRAWRLNNLHPRFYTVWLKPLRKLAQYWQKP